MMDREGIIVIMFCSLGTMLLTAVLLLGQVAKSNADLAEELNRCQTGVTMTVYAN